MGSTGRGAVTLFFAMILDALAGEPRWLWSNIPHPAVVMGRCVAWIDGNFNEGPSRKLKGALSFAGLCAGAVVMGWVISNLPFGAVIEIVFAAILLAQRSLVDHVRAVGDALRLSTGDGRLMVSRIVGRDTQAMDDPAVARAAIESAAENFSDGVVAPVFWFAVLGLPGLLLYKMTNTADSMIGYRTPRHQDFGWAAARFDDLLNWIPARLTAVLIVALYGLWGQWRAIVQDARRHRSPNAGWPEAAMARAIDVALAGPRSYSGKLQDFPYVHPHGNRNAGANEIDASVRVIWSVWGVLLVLVGVLAIP